MNKLRRKEIKAIVNNLSSILSELEMKNEEEQDYLDNMPDNLRDSINGMNSDEAISVIEGSIEALEDIISNLEEII